jgi:hypothetical protein
VNLVANEQAKLLATYLNGVAIAIAALGGVAPWIALVIQDTHPAAVRLTLVSGVCFLFSAGLHFAGRRALRRLRE